MTKPTLKEEMTIICLPETSWSNIPCQCEVCKALAGKRADKIITLLCAKMEEIEDSYATRFCNDACYTDGANKHGFEACRQAVLKMIKE